MRRVIEIISSSFKMALQELWKNKLRTFLSLFGVTIGIFCIIGVLATVNSLEINIRTEIRSLGSNTIYVDKWEYSASADYPYWKYVKRPVPTYEEISEIKKRSALANNVAFKISVTDKIEAGKNVLSNTHIYGISEDFINIQPIEIQYGRFLTDAEFGTGANTAVVGFDVAEDLFGSAEAAVSKLITLKGKQNLIVGVMKKQGTQLIGGWAFDESVLIPYKYGRTIMDEYRADPLIMVQGKENVSSDALKNDLFGAMRAVRRLHPTQEDNFALNDLNDFTQVLSQAFVSINIGGWAIGALAFIVGIFGVANIMFVTVRERTSQIGLKKALGAKRRTILMEFLLESAFLCIIGGLMGLLLVFVLTKVVTNIFNFPIFLSVPIMLLALVISIGAGILAGIIPALRAARMNPVTAIRNT